MAKIFGANWQTTVWGSVSAICVAIAASPALLAFLPDSIEGYVRGVAGLIAAAAGIGFAARAKDKDVTGGMVQQTANGAVASGIAQTDSSSVQDTKTSEPKK